MGAPTQFAPLPPRKPNPTNAANAGALVTQRRGAVRPTQSAAPARRATPPTTTMLSPPTWHNPASFVKALTPLGLTGLSGVLSGPTDFNDDPMSGDVAISGDSCPDTPSDASADIIPTTPLRRSPAARHKLAWDVPQTPTPRPAQRQPSAHTAPTTTATIDPQIEVDRTAHVVSSLIADLTWVAPGGSPSLTPPLRSLINAFFSAIPMDLLAEAITTNATLMDIITPHQAPPPPPPTPAQATGGKGKKRGTAPAPSRGAPSAPPAPSTTPKPSAAKPKKPTFAEAAKSTATATTGVNPPKFNPSPKIASPMRSKVKAPLSAAFKPLSPIAPEAQASGLAVIEHINRMLAPSHFQLKGCAWSPLGNFIATPHSPEDVDRLPRVLPRILQDMFKVPFSHLTFDLSSLVVVYNLPLGPSGNWTDPTAMALTLMAQNNYLEPLPASPGCWLANPDRHKGATASLRLSLSPQAKAAILKSGSLFFEGTPTLSLRGVVPSGRPSLRLLQPGSPLPPPFHGHAKRAPLPRPLQRRAPLLDTLPPLPKKARVKKPKAASSKAAPSGTGTLPINVSGSSVTDPAGNVTTHL
ncbi:hypothetical protein BOTBODRAFT_176878 [Botryobasidium botryosum FD-172 SS1]|uniref:Uncharacterized protein n=1 Tax=Botryobasidium botryosum (strain FD-172 SS1) TaxID=930990 RepID=A0A067M7Z6_BOTB1|nr:hypothetical protein BOTBODRAFT_176878 [Botryobasidium botryosum FD-172 SS1]